jgi:Flp pilus assembly protein TadD
MRAPLLLAALALTAQACVTPRASRQARSEEAFRRGAGLLFTDKLAAMAEWHRAVELNPDNEEARNGLERLEQEARDEVAQAAAARKGASER